MFKKKHSQILVSPRNRPLSPLRNRHYTYHNVHPLHQTNLSPMRNRSTTPKNRTQQAIRPHPYAQYSPNQKQKTFQGKLQSLVSDFSSKYWSKEGKVERTLRRRGDYPNEQSCFSNISNFSKQPGSKVDMKESKRLFTKCIQQMNSEKKRLSEQPSKMSTIDTTNITSFKALKIQMIQSVVPQEKVKGDIKMPFLELQRIQSEVTKPSITSNKDAAKNSLKQKISQKQNQNNAIELFNQSFTSAKPPLKEQQEIKVLEVGELEQKAKLMQSVYEEGSSDYTEFDQLIKKVEISGTAKVAKEQEQSVKVSVESIKSDFDMSPFI